MKQLRAQLTQWHAHNQRIYVALAGIVVIGAFTIGAFAFYQQAFTNYEYSVTQDVNEGAEVNSIAEADVNQDQVEESYSEEGKEDDTQQDLDQENTAAITSQEAKNAETQKPVATEQVTETQAANTENNQPAAEQAPQPTVAPTTTNEDVSRAADEAPVKQITVIIQAQGPGVSGSYTAKVAEGSTVLQAMKSAKGFRFTTSSFAGLGTYVDSVGGVSESQEQNLYWVYSVNGTKANSGVASYTLSNDATIRWVLEPSY